MKKWLFPILVPIVTASITAIFTHRLTLLLEKKKRIYEKREQLYLEIFDLLTQLKDDPYLIYDYTKMIAPMNATKAKIHLLASNKAIASIKQLYTKVFYIYNEYARLFQTPEYEQSCNNRIEYDDISQEQITWEHNEYCEKHLIDHISLNLYIDNIIKVMRKDLGTQRRF